MKLGVSVLLTCVFAVLLVAVNWLHMRLLPVDVVFYASIADAVVATAIMSLVLLAFRRFADFSVLEKLQMAVIWLLLGYSYAISVPTVIDRSLSFYILEKLEQRGGGIREDALERVFVEEYIPEYRLIDVRLTEQLESGTIVIENNCVKLTPKGAFIARMAGLYRRNMLPTKRLLVGEYTDALTDPFRNSAETVDYQCR